MYQIGIQIWLLCNFHSMFIILTCYLRQYNDTMNLVRYWGLSKLASETFRERPGKLTKGVLFHQDNAPAHGSVVVMAVVRDCGFELGDHSLYAPDLAPSGFSVPQHEKKSLSWWNRTPFVSLPGRSRTYPVWVYLEGNIAVNIRKGWIYACYDVKFHCGGTTPSQSAYELFSRP